MLSSSISFGSPNTLAATSVVDLLDDVLFTAGTDSDVAYLLKSGTLNANTALTGVLLGTPVSQALAANSLMISNVTASGDMAFYGNLGGNSQQFLFYDTSATVLYLRQIHVLALDTAATPVHILSGVAGTDPYILIGRSDTGVATNATTDMLVFQAGAGATNVANNFGFGLAINLSNDAHEVEKRAAINFVVNNATNGAETSIMQFQVCNALSLTTVLQLYKDSVSVYQPLVCSSSVSATNAQFTPASGASVNVGTSANFKRFYAEVTLSTTGAETDVGLTPAAVILSAAIRVSVEIAGLDDAEHHIQLGITGTASKYIDVTQGASATTISVNKKGKYTFDPTTDTEAAALKLTITGGADQTPTSGKVYVEVIYLSSANLADV